MMKGPDRDDRDDRGHGTIVERSRPRPAWLDRADRRADRAEREWLEADWPDDDEDDGDGPGPR